MRAIERIGLLISLLMSVYVGAKLPDGELRLAIYVAVAFTFIPLLVGFIADWMADVK
ncbi:hypothetical protein HY496_01045 [Candidatus Woesearchaeota archaeon]|nr:hypothetical protein [Candidatus Woesearchaeota archaeon]